MADTGENTQNMSVSLEFWEDRWKTGETGWHEEDYHRGLTRNLTTQLKSTFGDAELGNLKVLVPLCGKTKDLMLFYNMGFSVVGIEFALKAAEDFFTENKLEKNEKSNEKLLATCDERIQILVGDLYSYDSTNLPFPKYDIIWDRGSFVAINTEDRSKYAALLTSLMEPKACLYLMEAFDYPKHEYSGPPMSVPLGDIESAFGTHNCVAIGIDSENRFDAEKFPEESAMWASLGMSRITANIYVIKHKQQ